MVPTSKKKFKTRRIARSKEEIKSIRARANLRKSNLIKKRNEVLKSLDKTVAGYISVLDVLTKANKRDPRISTKEFVLRSRAALLETLKFMKENSREYMFNDVQLRSLDIFLDKVSSATTTNQLHEAFEYFTSKSCMLKLKK